MQPIVANNHVDMALTRLFVTLYRGKGAVLLRALIEARHTNHRTTHEEPYIALASMAS